VFFNYNLNLCCEVNMASLFVNEGFLVVANNSQVAHLLRRETAQYKDIFIVPKS
jgi:hypothetical protein